MSEREGHELVVTGEEGRWIWPTLYYVGPSGRRSRWEVNVWRLNSDKALVEVQWGREFRNTQVRQQSICRPGGKDSEMLTPAVRAALEQADRKWMTKYTRGFYAATVEEAEQRQRQKPLPERVLTASGLRHCMTLELYAQPKFRGLRCTAGLAEDGTVQLRTRYGVPLPDFPDIAGRLKEMIRNTTTLDGVLQYPGLSGRQLEKRIWQGKLDKSRACYVVCDVQEPYLRFPGRWSWLKEQVCDESAGCVMLAPTQRIFSRQLASFCQWARLQGYPAIILRRADVGYCPRATCSELIVGKWHSTWFCRVSGVLPPERPGETALLQCPSDDGPTVTIPTSWPPRKVLEALTTSRQLEVHYQNFDLLGHSIPELPVPIKLR